MGDQCECVYHSIITCIHICLSSSPSINLLCQLLSYPTSAHEIKSPSNLPMLTPVLVPSQTFSAFGVSQGILYIAMYILHLKHI